MKPLFWAMAALLGAVAGLVAFSVLLVVRACCDGANAGDWLNFAGVIFGVLLTIGATKLVDWMLNRAQIKRRKEEFTTAIRSVVMGLTHLAEAEPGNIRILAQTALSLWRVAGPVVDAMPDLSFDQRVQIGIAQMALDESLPVLASNATLTATNPGLVETVKVGAAALCQTILPLTELFDPKPPKAPAT